MTIQVQSRSKPGLSGVGGNIVDLSVQGIAMCLCMLQESWGLQGLHIVVGFAHRVRICGRLGACTLAQVHTTPFPDPSTCRGKVDLSRKSLPAEESI